MSWMILPKLALKSVEARDSRLAKAAAGMSLGIAIKVQTVPDICKYDPKAKYKTLCDRPLPLQLAFAILDNTSQLLVFLGHCN